jgi:3-hydroxyacyl-[acyl-carrier-protein] dehydratase
MPPLLLVDLQGIDLNHIEIPPEEIRKVNPHRYEMEQLDGIIKFAPDQGFAIGVKNVTDKEFWVRGHIPGRPLLPGVLMLEAAAQLCTFYYKRVTQEARFLGFGGLDSVKFRGTVVPGNRLIILVKSKEIRARRAIFDTQGIVDGRVVFEAVVTGLLV